MSDQTFAMVCGVCRWKGNLGPTASDKCPQCGAKLRLQAGESRKLLQKACGEEKPAPPEPVIISRVIHDKDAPKDEGQWEFCLRDGILTVIAWNDDKTEAGAVEIGRRGIGLYMNVKKKAKDDDAP